MAQILEFTVPADGFSLGRIFKDLPGATVELEQVVPTNEGIFPYFWGRGVENDVVIDAFAERELVDSVRLVDDVDGGLFRVEWDDEVDGVIKALAEADVTLITGTGTADQWVFEVRAEDSQALSEFLEYCRSHDPQIPVTVDRVHSLTDIGTEGQYSLTSKQREALALAFNEGYFNEPRDVKLEELASTLGISRPSLSSRLRRGYRNLIANTIVNGDQ